jgi:hypothetical protein
MDDSFLRYLQQLELMAFFSGYPLVYAIILFITGNQKGKDTLKTRIASLLPLAYALVGTLYLGFQIKKLYPDYSIENIRLTMQPPWLILWGILAILFWIPSLSKKKILTLIHSLVYFFFLVKDLFLQLFPSSANGDIIRNDMQMYANSILLNLGAVAFILLISFVLTRYKKRLIS